MMSKERCLSSRAVVLLAFAAIFTTGCKGGTVTAPTATDRSGGCTFGQSGCFCSESRDCQGAGESCLQGFCVPTGCNQGELDCACGRNGECSGALSSPLTCVGNICREVPLPDPGTLGGGCGTEVPCVSSDTTVTLDCLDGMCEQAGCPSGTVGCPCGSYGYCTERNGQQARCVEGRCMIGLCSAGSAGCRCSMSASPCGGGMLCVGGICRDEGRIEMAVVNQDVRACDLLLGEDGRFVDRVRFAPQVRGEQLHRSPSLSISFNARRDRPLTGPVLTIERRSAADARGLSIVRSRCYDRTGAVVNEPGLGW